MISNTSKSLDKMTKKKERIFNFLNQDCEETSLKVLKNLQYYKQIL